MDAAAEDVWMLFVLLLLLLLLFGIVSFPRLLLLLCITISDADMRPTLPLRGIDGEDDLDELTLLLALRRRCAAGDSSLSASLLSECTLGSNLAGLVRFASAWR